MTSFDYFPTFPGGAQLREEACSFCARSPAIPAVRLKLQASEEKPKAVCADCLRIGRARTEVPTWVERELTNAVRAAHPEWDSDEVARHVASRVDALSHTPPVPWLQNNEWPACKDDFAVYRGELTRDTLLGEYGSVARAKEALDSVIKEVRPEWTLDEEALGTAWEQLGNFVAIFVFQCPSDQRPIYVLQTA